MKMTHNVYKRAQQSHIYLGTADNRKICVLNGIRPESVQLSLKLNNTFDLSFQVDRYLDCYGRQIESGGYHLLDEAMRLYVENIGWFIMQAPSVQNDGTTESKSVNAESADCELVQRDLVGFKINMGTTDSWEMLSDENVEIDESGVEHALSQIRFYDEDNPDLSLLHLVLQASELDGWTIGEIDNYPKVYTSFQDGELIEKHILLQDEIPYFNVDSQSVYAFLTQSIARYFECVVLFDIENFTINIYRVEHLGKDTNITIGLRNLQTSNSITVDENSIYTRYRVSGGGGLNIRYVNFGHDIIENLDYKLNTRYMPADLIEKYKIWRDDLEINRIEYIRLTRLYNEQLNIISELSDRVPLDDCSTDWYTFSLTALQTELSDYEAYKLGLESLFKDNNGMVDMDALMASDIAGEYHQIVDIIMPNIEIAMHNKVITAGDDKEEYIEVTDWSLCGIDELDTMLKKFEGEKEILEKNGYSEPYSEESGHTKDYHDRCYAKYLETLDQLNENVPGSCAEAYVQRTDEAAEAKMISEQYLTERTSIARSVEKESWCGTSADNKPLTFTAEDLKLLASLYNDTDYTNDNMFLVSTDDQLTAIDEQQKLLDAAVNDLAGTSRPQYRYTTTLDNFLPLAEYKDYAKHLNLGDFIWLGIRDDYQVRLRVIGITYNPAVFDNQITIEFSNMVKARAARNDFAALLSLNGGSGKNKISGSANSSSANTNTGSLQYILDKILSSTAFTNKVNNSINQTFGGYIGTLMVLKELEAEMIKCVNLKAENGFFGYLRSELISAGMLIAGSGEFQDLKTLVARIDNLLAGNVSAELGHIIQLTAENVTISEAVIKHLIAAQIMVSDLRAGDISTDRMHIMSEDGGLAIIGNTMQFRDQTGTVRIQIGRDNADDFTFTLYDAAGTGVLIDSSGIKPSAIEDGLIRTNMIADGAISEAKIDKDSIREWTDSEGNKIFDVAALYYGDDKFEVSYNQIISNVDDISTNVTRVESKVDAAAQTIIDKISRSEMFTVTDKEGNPISKVLNDILVESTADISGLHNTVSNIRSEFTDDLHELTEQVSEMKQDADGFKTTVSKTYATKSDLSDYTTTTEMNSIIGQTAGEIYTSVSDNANTISQLQQTAETLTTKVTNAENDVSALTQTAKGFESKVTAINDTLNQKKDIYPSSIRYIRDWLNGNSADTGNHWAECRVMANNQNIANGLIAAAYDQNGNSLSASANINCYTDEETGEYVSLAAGSKYLQLDLGHARSDIDSIQIWHYYADGRSYNHKLEVSSNGEDWFILYDSLNAGSYPETAEGKLYYLSDKYIDKQISLLTQDIYGIDMRVADAEDGIANLSIASDGISTIVTDAINTYDENNSSAFSSLQDKVSNNYSTLDQKIDTLTTQISKDTDELAKNLSTVQQTATDWIASFEDITIGTDAKTQTNVRLSKNGLEITNPTTGLKTNVTTDEFAGYYNDQKVFSLNQDLTITRRIQVDNGADFTNIKYTNATYQTTSGTTVKALVHIKSGGSS